MFYGGSDFAAIVELNAGRFDEVKKDMSDTLLDKFVKRGLGAIDDLIDAATCPNRDSSVVALRQARNNLNKFLDEWEARKDGRVKARLTWAVTGVPESADQDDDEDDNDDD